MAGRHTVGPVFAEHRTAVPQSASHEVTYDIRKCRRRIRSRFVGAGRPTLQGRRQLTTI